MSVFCIFIWVNAWRKCPHGQSWFTRLETRCKPCKTAPVLHRAGLEMSRILTHTEHTPRERERILLNEFPSLQLSTATRTAGLWPITADSIQPNLLEVTSAKLTQSKPPSLSILLPLGVVIKSAYVKPEEKACLLVAWEVCHLVTHHKMFGFTWSPLRFVQRSCATSHGVSWQRTQELAHVLPGPLSLNLYEIPQFIRNRVLLLTFFFFYQIWGFCFFLCASQNWNQKWRKFRQQSFSQTSFEDSNNPLMPKYQTTQRTRKSGNLTPRE